LASTGIPALDKILAGGYPERSAILIEGVSSNEKEMIGYEFIRSGLDSGEPCLYVTRLSRSDVINDAMAFGIDLGRVTSWMCPEGGDRTFATEDLTSISVGFKGALKEYTGRRVRVAFDLSSKLLMTNTNDSVNRFLSQLLAEMKSHDATLVATVQKDMHPSQVIAGLELLFDGVLEVKRFEHTRAEVKVKKMRGIKPVESSVMIALEKKAKAEPAAESLGTRRIAVLPFVNMSSDPDDEFFADGLTEELIDRLCQIRQLEVIARTSVMTYKNKEMKAAEIGSELKVRTLVEGSIRKSGDRIRVTAQLIDVKTEGHLWSSRYDSVLQDIFAVQSDIAEKIVEALRLNLVDSEKEKIERKATSVPEAFFAYLNGVYFRYKASSEGMWKAVEYNSRAIELDPDYADAYAQLAMDYIWLGVFWGEPAAQAFSKAKELAAKAMELDPNLAEPHYAMSWVSYFYDMDWAAAEREGARAIELKPSYAEPRFPLACTHLALGRRDEALSEARKAIVLDPLGVYSHLVLAWVLSVFGEFDEATQWHRKAIEIEPDSAFIRQELGFTYLYMGKVDEGVSEMEKAMRLPGGELFKAGLGYGYAVAGRKEEALKIAKELELVRAEGKAKPYDIAMIYSGLGENSKALDLLDQALQENSIVRLLLLNVEPAFTNLRPEPRFKALLKRLNLGG
jgi:TolB-like protein